MASSDSSAESRSVCSSESRAASRVAPASGPPIFPSASAAAGPHVGVGVGQPRRQRGHRAPVADGAQDVRPPPAGGRGRARPGASSSGSTACAPIRVSAAAALAHAHAGAARRAVEERRQDVGRHSRGDDALHRGAPHPPARVAEQPQQQRALLRPGGVELAGGPVADLLVGGADSRAHGGGIAGGAHVRLVASASDRTASASPRVTGSSRAFTFSNRRSLPAPAWPRRPPGASPSLAAAHAQEEAALAALHQRRRRPDLGPRQRSTSVTSSTTRPSRRPATLTMRTLVLRVGGRDRQAQPAPHVEDRDDVPPQPDDPLHERWARGGPASPGAG